MEMKNMKKIINDAVTNIIGTAVLLVMVLAVLLAAVLVGAAAADIILVASFTSICLIATLIILIVRLYNLAKIVNKIIE